LNTLYLIEGLDCSGKKTVAAEVHRLLCAEGLSSEVVIGPLYRGPLNRLDAFVTHVAFCRTRMLGRALKEIVYFGGPIFDGLLYRPNVNVVLKVSSHFRAWARSELTPRPHLSKAFALTRFMHVRFAGATLLNASFSARVQRHLRDFECGRTQKDLRQRFLDCDDVAFAKWNDRLQALLFKNIPDLLVLDSTTSPPTTLAESIAAHAQHLS
jgi:hypothetical protein